MSVSEELRIITDLTDIDHVKNKRSIRRGILTRLKTKLDELSSKPLRDIKLRTLEQQQSTYKDNLDIHDALQRKYIELLATRPSVTEKDISDEQERADGTKENHSNIGDVLSDWIFKIKYYHQGVILQQSIASVQELRDLFSPVITAKLQRLEEQVQEYQVSTMDFAADSDLSPLRQQLRDEIKEVFARHVAEQDRISSSDSASLTRPTPTTAPPIYDAAKLKLELPKFSGEPTEWADFFELFSAAINKRGRGLCDQEKSCLLIEAMATEEAKQVARAQSSGTDGYEKAVQALSNNYGHPRKVYPHHVRQLVLHETYTYDRASLRQMRENLEVHTRGLKRMKGYSIEQFLAAVVVDNFDERMRDEWIKHTATFKNLPNYEDIINFFQPLEFSMADSISKKSSTSQSKKTTVSAAKPKTTSIPKVTANRNCPLCSAEHPLHRCSTFLSYDAIQRQKVVKDNRYCTNCLSSNHTFRQCTSTFNCRHCNQRHNSLLHRDSSSNTETEATKRTYLLGTSSFMSDSTTGIESSVAPPTIAFLNTAVVNTVNGSRHRHARAALDTGAATSLITEGLASHLRLKRYPQRSIIEGAYGGGKSKYYVQATLQSIINPEDEVTLRLTVIPKLPAVPPPKRKQDILSDQHIKDLKLADPDFGGQLDILIGSLDCCRCVLGSFKYHPVQDIAVSPTIFGWTVTGPLDYQPSTPILKIQIKVDPLQQDLERLWELEKTPETPVLTTEDEIAMCHFNDTYRVDRDGRYIVELPKLLNAPTIGASRHMALRRFEQNEKSLKKKGRLEDFDKVLQEYVELNHAEPVPHAELKKVPPHVYYLPVHGIFKDSSTTTKVRAVFDASARSSTGVSLNDILMTGPNLYPLLSDVLIQFRLHRIGLCADISKMFREVLLHDQERDLHRFLLRDKAGQIRDHRMKRLTFGIKCSPFLATRVIRHLAESHSTTHPAASQAILKNFYVDDYLSGADNVEDADILRQQLCQLLQLAGMTLCKWRTNSDDLRQRIPGNLIVTEDLHLPAPHTAPKALGMHWDVAKDNFHIAIPTIEQDHQDGNVTKRYIASVSSKVYDILGLFAPATIPSKVLLQSLWKLQLKWDDKVPDDVHQKWKRWMSSLLNITNHPISRRLITSVSPIIFRALHGFADSSSIAYGAAVYLRAVHEDMSVSVSLITAKARVLPVKTVTIPRAELVAAHLLARLLLHVSKLLEISTSQVFAWTDSAIVLCWLKKIPSSLKTFVSHRVAAIQNMVPTSNWRHVPSKENPADLLSRGVYAEQLVEMTIWWHGPIWLSQAPEKWPLPNSSLPKVIPDTKAVVAMVRISKPIDDLWTRYSSFDQLCRIIAWIRRFIHNARSPSLHCVYKDILKSEELKSSKLLVLKTAQEQVYDDVHDYVRKKQNLPKGHALSRLHVYKDDDHLLRVSGRVRDAKSSTQPKVLIPLSLRSPITRLLVSTLHRSKSHPGIATLLAIIGDTYYIPGLRNFLKHISRQCAICQRAYAKPIQQEMGLLPLVRTTPAPPFDKTGVDFAGPFYIRQGHTRRPVIVKTYACLFVCLVTRAVHLELCSDLTTEEFMAALQRFCARRGTPSDIYSDNGTNFHGAKNEIKELQQLQLSKATRQALSHFVSKTSVAWHFIPPRAPHFGGLWEAGVRSMKILLRKLVSPHTLRFEELYTILTEVEAILNSRPLLPLHSTDTADDIALTPGHFIIGRPLKALPSTTSSNVNIKTLRRWALVQRLTQDLWMNWKGRYLHSLQTRSKWTKASHDVRVGDIVFVKDEILKHRDWPIARIVKTYTGDDGHVRAVDITCQGKVFRRPANRLIIFNGVDQPSPQYVQDYPLSILNTKLQVNSRTQTL